MAGAALVIPPLQTIQLQMVNICSEWHIPFLNLSECSNPEEIVTKIAATRPKIILCSIEDISRVEVQSSLQLVPIKYIAIDECQVSQPFLSSEGYLVLIFLS